MGLMRKRVPEEIDAASLISVQPATMRAPPREGDRLMADIERMKAEIDSLKELREANSQRLADFNEKIGEIRAMITSRERQMEEMGNRVTQATDILNAIKAQDVIKLMAKNEMAMSGLEARIDANTDVIKNLMQETKEIKERQNIFKGTEVVKELNEQIRGELATIKKIESRVDINASKVEKMFNDVEGKYKDFLRAKSLADSMEKEFRILKKDFDATKVEMSNVYNQSDFENFKTNVLNQINALVSGYRELRTGGGKEIPKETVDIVRNNVFQVDINTKDIKTVQKRLDELRDEVSASKETMNKLPATFPTMEDLQKRIDLAVQQSARFVKTKDVAERPTASNNEIKVLQKSVEDIQNQLKEMDNSEIESLHSEIDGIKSALKSRPSAKNDDLRDEIDKLKADMEQVKVPMPIEEIRRSIDETKEAMESLRSQASGKDTDDLKMKVADLEARVSRSRDTTAIDSRIFKIEDSISKIKSEQSAELKKMKDTLYQVCEQVEVLSTHMQDSRPRQRY